MARNTHWRPMAMTYDVTAGLEVRMGLYLVWPRPCWARSYDLLQSSSASASSRIAFTAMYTVAEKWVCLKVLAWTLFSFWFDYEVANASVRLRLRPAKKQGTTVVFRLVKWRLHQYEIRLGRPIRLACFCNILWKETKCSYIYGGARCMFKI